MFTWHIGEVSYSKLPMPLTRVADPEPPVH